MHETDGQELAAYCGLYCGACAIKNGRLRDTASKLHRLLEAYKYATWAPQVAGFFPAAVHYPEFEGVLEWLMTQGCPACREGGGLPQCAIRICAREQDLAGCWECEATSCQKLRDLGQAWPASLENRERIQTRGLGAWLQEQAARVAGGYPYFNGS